MVEFPLPRVSSLPMARVKLSTVMLPAERTAPALRIRSVVWILPVTVISPSTTISPALALLKVPVLTILPAEKLLEASTVTAPALATFPVIAAVALLAIFKLPLLMTTPSTRNWALSEIFRVALVPSSSTWIIAVPFPAFPAAICSLAFSPETLTSVLAPPIFQ